MNRRTFIKGAVIAASSPAIATSVPQYDDMTLPAPVIEAVVTWRRMMREQKSIWDGKEHSRPDDHTYARWREARGAQLDALTDMVRTLHANT